MVLQDVLRELINLLEEATVSKMAPPAQAAALDMQRLSLKSTQPPATTNSYTSAASKDRATTSTAPAPPASQGSTQHASGSLQQQHDGCTSSHPAVTCDAQHPPDTAPVESHAHTFSASELSRMNGQHEAGEGGGDAAEAEDGDDSDADSVLDFQSQELMAEEAHRVVAATAVLRSTFATIKGSTAPTSVAAVTGLALCGRGQ